MTKPSEFLDWGGTPITPTAGKKAAGFAAGERPARGLFNWSLQTIDAWLKYLAPDDFTLALSGVAGVPRFDNVANEPGMIVGSATGELIANPAASTAEHRCTVAIPLRAGDRVTSVTVHVDRGSVSGTVTATLYTQTMTGGGTVSSEDTDTTAAGTGTATLTLTGSHTLAANENALVLIDFSSTGSTDGRFYGIEVTYDRP